ncbi:hypothetical protein I7I53_01232 [Histoplasma capsulatum var. duboisii H88]|uniref:Uncharacterized protein n=1 Tax=Ajellomyces capsulatus (strain H88) TaxID=544711 RepID=A0A8A1LN29_AJEC8|nr:hypothetical protein I7I53_01232 [Histoplasma capsulatum var. duboisii H88]
MLQAPAQPEGARRTMIGEAASGVKQLPPHEIIGLNFPTCSSTRAESFSGAVQLLARKLANPSSPCHNCLPDSMNWFALPF